MLNEYSGVCNIVGTIFAKEMNLKNDMVSIKSRKNFCDIVEYTFIRAYNGNWRDFGKRRFISSSLGGNLSSWYTNELNYNDKAPLMWRTKIIEYMYKRYGIVNSYK